MTNLQLQDKCRGSLVGGAVGDALGYEVEFMRLPAIRRRFGEHGISEYVLHNGVAEFSDDTQMTLFTTEGLLCALAAESDALPYITKAYVNWYYTQKRSHYKDSDSWLSHLNALWDDRAPGNTCMSALRTIAQSNGSPVINNSKGCGGVMRVAPIGIFAATHPDLLNLEQAGYLAGYSAEATHKHPLSTFASMTTAMIVAECLKHENIDREMFKDDIVERMFTLLENEYSWDGHLSKLHSLVRKALDFAISDRTDTEAIRELGEGWVAEETLAIAFFSVMRYFDDFERCIRCAVNHDGDSDSTGAIAGNIIGAILGYKAIPQKYLTNLELHDVIVSVADDLGGFSSEEQIRERYMNHNPYSIKKDLLI